MVSPASPWARSKGELKALQLRFPRVFLLAVGIVCASTFCGPAGSQQLPEYRVKAALLYKLSKFIEWPAEAFTDSATPFRICVIGRDSFGTALDAVAGKVVQGRKLVIQHARAFERMQETCHVAFISISEQAHLQRILGELEGQPVLTVSDIKGFAERGGIMNLVTRNNRVRFAINLESSKRAGLLISAQLLELASVVEDSRAEEDK